MIQRLLLNLHMMKSLLLCSILFTGLLFSCSENKKEILHLKHKKYQPFIINLAHTFSDDELNMSFPIWFADSIIRENGIVKIIRHIYPSNSNENQESQIPKESKYYHFNEEGQILSVEINQFYEYIKVGSLKFDYLAQKDEFGYAPVEMKFKEIAQNEEIADQFSLYEKVEYAEKFLVYKNEHSGDYLFYMLNRENWGGLSVDSILRPTPNDIIVLGSPNVPSKSYQVENTVNEFKVVNYSFDNSHRYPTEVRKNNFPFHHKRSVVYDANGNCTGYIDSTFNGSDYLTRRNSQFVFKDGLPIKIIHESKSNNSEHGFMQIEEFEYEFSAIEK